MKLLAFRMLDEADEMASRTPGEGRGTVRPGSAPLPASGYPQTALISQRLEDRCSFKGISMEMK